MDQCSDGKPQCQEIPCLNRIQNHVSEGFVGHRWHLLACKAQRGAEGVAEEAMLPVLLRRWPGGAAGRNQVLCSLRAFSYSPVTMVLLLLLLLLFMFVVFVSSLTEDSLQPSGIFNLPEVPR